MLVHSEYLIIFVTISSFKYDFISVLLFCKKCENESCICFFLMQYHIERPQRATTKCTIDMHTYNARYFLCNQLFTTRSTLGRPFKNMACWCTWYNIVIDRTLSSSQPPNEKLKMFLIIVWERFYRLRKLEKCG